MKKISKELNITKRRLYDLTNVLEDIGYLKKYRRNIMKITPEFINQITNLAMLKEKRFEAELTNKEDENIIINNENEEAYLELQTFEMEDKK